MLWRKLRREVQGLAGDEPKRAYLRELSDGQMKLCYRMSKSTEHWDDLDDDEFDLVLDESYRRWAEPRGWGRYEAWDDWDAPPWALPNASDITTSVAANP